MSGAALPPGQVAPTYQKADGTQYIPTYKPQSELDAESAPLTAKYGEHPEGITDPADKAAYAQYAADAQGNTFYPAEAAADATRDHSNAALDPIAAQTNSYGNRGQAKSTSKGQLPGTGSSSQSSFASLLTEGQVYVKTLLGS